VFEETGAERTQEFVLRWFSDGGHSFREIVHQQWNSARQTQHARPRTIGSNSRMSQFSNW